MMTQQDIVEFIQKTIGPSGRMLSGSKSFYRKEHPRHLVCFNASVAVDGFSTVWRGDLDLSTADEQCLIDLAKKADYRRVSVLYEHSSGRDPTWSALQDEASGRVHISFDETFYDRDFDEKILLKIEPPHVIMEQELSRIDNDRASFKPQDLQDQSVEFPYKAVADAAKSRRIKDQSPLLAYIAAIQAVDKPEGTLHLDAIIHADDMEVLRRAIRSKNKRINPWLSDYRIDRDISWELFNYGPTSFVKSGTPDCIKKGRIWFRKRQR